MTRRWHIGCDLGQVRDRTSLALIEPHASRWALTWLRTWQPSRRDCMDVLDELIRVVRSAPAGDRPAVGIDGRGAYRDVAAAALEGALAREADVYPLLPSDSDRGARTREDGWTFVGKKPLVDSLRSAVASRRLVIAAGLPEGQAFVDELMSLSLLPTRSGRGLTWSHPDQGKHSHDDRVQAVAYAWCLVDALTTQGLMTTIHPARPRR